MRATARARLWLALGITAMVAIAIPAVALASFGDRVLRRGMHGDDVRTLQSTLTKLGFPASVDGGFGAGTDAAVRRYERKVRIRVDGVVSRSEARGMRRRAAAIGTGPGAQKPGAYQLGDRTLRRGMQGDDVSTLQSDLTKLGQPTAADGSFGGGTEASVRSYESRQSLPVDGVVDPDEGHAIARQASQAPKPSSAEADHAFPVRGPHDYGGPDARYGAGRPGHIHQGQDVMARAGTPIVAAYAGKVAWKQYQAGGAGYYVVIQGNDGRDYVYMHMIGPASVDAGQTVSTGQPIGQVGCTGSCSGPHLHFELWTPHWYDGGHTYDPLPYLQRWDAGGQ